jgi:alkanesulfonate monooxygenase SsuD/methylene tetrahydromethanopterin reductase-like flavin-dependent oxidoreductase (luciferase family)
MRIGVTLPIGERGDPPRAVHYSQIRELALLAEAGGLDSIWAADHLFHEPATGPRRGLWENWTILTALAEATERVHLGPLVMCTPFRNPGMIAWQANALDEISAGRLVLGLGAGWHDPEFKAFGFEFEHRVSLFADSLAVLVPLLRDGKVDHDGRFASGHTELSPRGPSPKGPPIMISAFGPRMMALAAQWADRYNTVWYGLPNDGFAKDVANLLAACEKRGRDPAEIEVSTGLMVLDDEVGTRQTNSDWLASEPAAIADALAAWRDEGVAEVMCRPDPATPQMLEHIIRAAEMFRTGAGAPQ